MVTEQELDAFCHAVQEKRVAAMRDPGVIVYQKGRKYAKIIESYNGTGRSVFCFVDMKDGAILKAASWKAPEPNLYSRGNIKNGAADVTLYGAKYLIS